MAAPRVVIVGGGFAGLQVARGLSKAPVDIVIVDHSNHHVFQPLLYQVATASLNPSDIAAPIRRILRRQRNVSVVLAEAISVDHGANELVLADGRIGFDYLVIATGVSHSYFAHPEWERFAPGLKSIEDALKMRKRLLVAFEAAEREQDPVSAAHWLTFVVIGGGPTGVELAGALIEIAHHAFRSDFRNIDPRTARVILLEGSDRILPGMRPELSAKALTQLQALGVEVMTSTLASDVDEEAVTAGSGRIPAKTVFWAAGVKGSAIGATLGAPLDEVGRVRVSQDLSVAGGPNVFVAGDLARVDHDGVMVPGVAPAAMQQGKLVARNILARIANNPTAKFVYRDKGTLATIGRASAVADLGWVRLSGYLAWIAWLAIHIFFLIGFRNRLVVMLEWVRAYLTYERQARIITDDIKVVFPQKDQDS